MISQKSKAPVPTPVSLVRYLEDPEFEHEDFTLSSAITLRARVSGRIIQCVCVCVCVCARVHTRAAHAHVHVHVHV